MEHNLIKRISSLLLVFVIVVTVGLSTITTTHAAETEVALDKYSFLETVCGMFNCLYIPDELAQSDIATWDSVKNYSDSFDLLLNSMEFIYKKYISTEGFQTSDSTAENYVRPSFYNSDISVDSVFSSYMTYGCLDFTGELSENEYILVRDAFNELFKRNYDFNHNLSDYRMEYIAEYVSPIRVSLDGTYILTNIGYNFPNYSYPNDELFSSGVTSSLNFISNYSEEGFGINHYICNYPDFDASTSGYDNRVSKFNLIGVYLEDTVFENLRPLVVRQTGSKIYIYFNDEPIIRYKFGLKSNAVTNTELSSFTALNYTSALSQQVNGLYTCFSPLLSVYRFGTSVTSYTEIHNWGQDLVVGSSEAWDTYCTFLWDYPNAKYYPLSLEGFNSVITNRVDNVDNIPIIDNITGVFTGDIVIEEDPEFDYDLITDSIGQSTNQIQGSINQSTEKIEDAISESTGYLTDAIEEASNNLLYGGNFTIVDGSTVILDDTFAEYSDIEAELIDYTNMDDTMTTFFNTADLVENTTNITTVSTYFMTLWDSFGAWGILFTLAIALGIATFLLKI